MGCCVSSAKPSASQKHHHSPVGTHPVGSADASENRASHPLAEEETVKEVLSETPKSKPPQQDYQPATKPVFGDVEDNKNNDEDEDKIDKFHSPINAATDNDISELSEVYSLSESVSTTTTKRDEDEEVRQRVHRSSPAKAQLRSRVHTGDFGAKRSERLLGKSPTRRSDQSPGRMNSGSSRLVHGREPIAGRGFRATEPPPNRRNPSGEASSRRSRSPATRVDNGPSRSVMGQSPSARRTNRSPSRVKSAPTETNARKMEQTKNDNAMEGKWPTTSTTTTANESLENPLVSLECFIFL
ncbi:hypothetical protein FH972_000385 [Carpinus fangiana]|uniref:Uncharacterized protein n=1 Tax=Carpinus fangiana TaxID=176857 RepID=A0A5N6QAG5_9ROSI|nr:hypothetical protein FH972_000385 [Carpinus fangiana]